MFDLDALALADLALLALAHRPALPRTEPAVHRREPVAEPADPRMACPHLRALAAGEARP